MPDLPRILIIGSGGREHALALALLDSPLVKEVCVLPGNGGTAQVTLASGKVLRNVTGDALDVARELAPSLVVVGPEGPLCDGIVDRLSDAGFVTYGPSRRAAQLEASKAFMKSFVARHGVKTARFEIVTNEADLVRAVRSFALPPVIKADGLCAGKGVVVASTYEEAIEAGREMLSGAAFGEAGKTVVVEERISGAEASVHAVCDGKNAVILPVAQDHKRIGDGDTGPNTGGMGTYAPAPIVSAELLTRVRQEIIEPVLAGMSEEGIPFRGTLFAGLMITPDGEPLLLEINVRFGDPETQVLMNVSDGDLAATLYAAACGQLTQRTLTLTRRHAICVVLAAHGYPGKVRTGDTITGLDAAAAIAGVKIYHAGTCRDGDKVVTSGGRVLGVTAVGDTLKEAHERAYRAADLIQFDGKQVRRDIGHRVLG